MQRKYIKIWASAMDEWLGVLTDREAGTMIKAMVTYVSTGREPEFADRALLVLWKTLKGGIDRDQEDIEGKSRGGKKHKEAPDVAQTGHNVAQNKYVEHSSTVLQQNKNIEREEENRIQNTEKEIENEIETEKIYSPPEGGHPPDSGHNVAHHKAGDPCPWFERAWEAYPRKEGKSRISRARKEALNKDGEEAVMSAIENYKKIIRKDGREREGYVLMGSTFFNGRYRDYIDISEIEKPEKNLEDDDWNKGALIV